MSKKKVLINAITGFGGQFIILILGLIVPRVMLTSYGSDVNGLISTITQLFSYMALLEAGIGQATRNALFMPIAKKDKEGISYVISVSLHYFHRITVYYGMGVIALAVAAPFLLNTEVDKLTVFLVIIFEGMSGVVTFYFIQTIRTLLTALGKGYINNTILVVNRIITYVVRIVLASVGVSIVLLQFCYFILTIIQVLVYRYYYARNYSWIDTKCAPKTAKLQDRNAYILTEIAWTVFTSTDMIVLSMFVSTKAASVYNVYNLVFHSLHVLLNSVYSSVNYLLGHTFHKSREQYVKMHDAFMSVFMGAITAMMSVGCILCLPFIKLYTSGVNDTEYIYEALPIMFCLVQMISWSRYIQGNLVNVAGYASKAVKINLAEATTNVVLSIALVHKFGIIGVLFATVIALPLKGIYCTYMADKVILQRSYRNSIMILGVNYLIFAFAIFVNKTVPISINSYIDFVKVGALTTIVFLVISIAANLIVNPQVYKMIKVIVGDKLGRSRQKGSIE